MTKARLTKEQKAAFTAYQFAERQEDRYKGSVLVTPTGLQRYREKTRAAYDNCLRQMQAPRNGRGARAVTDDEKQLLEGLVVGALAGAVGVIIVRMIVAP